MGHRQPRRKTHACPARQTGAGDNGEVEINVRLKMNKETERYYLQEFLKLMPELQGLNPIDCEQPDFLCDVDGNRVGIEETRFSFALIAVRRRRLRRRNV